MTPSWGYPPSCARFVVPLVVLVAARIRAKAFRPFLSWATIVAATLSGTTAADFSDRSVGIDYTGGSPAVLACLLRTPGAH